ncbi:DoxX family protein [Chitinophaga rhizophila]|uniref:DoxX family protein n=1 Tax=Chitinophaga rhizophila TaxID=2866212 RepID=A0ABS7GEI7_9BACT|nr:DoxX family protein [Chitinophaga rhizophila]MBW8685695.1 DoxX family protein [Chitinophaga rhizophila]
MVEIITQLLYTDAGSDFNNWVLLLFRILLAVQLFRVHGLKKFRVVNGEREHVPNPLHLPERINGMMATLADIVAPFLVIIGIATRLVVLPIIGVTAVGYFVVHRHDNAEVRDVPFMYTLCFLFLLCIGAGTLSADHYIYSLLTQ